MNKPNYDKIAETLRREVCPKCKKHPEIKVNTENLSISTCCQQFQDMIVSKYEQYLIDYASKETNNIFKVL